MRRTKVIGSLNRWQPPPQNESSDLLGRSEDTSPQLNDTGPDQILDNNNAGEIVENSLIDTSSNQIRPLSKSSIVDVLSHVSSYYSQCKDNVKLVVGAMAIKLKELVVSGTKSTSALEFNVQSATVETLTNAT